MEGRDALVFMIYFVVVIGFLVWLYRRLNR